MKNLFYIPLFLLFVTACSQKTLIASVFMALVRLKKTPPFRLLCFQIENRYRCVDIKIMT